MDINDLTIGQLKDLQSLIGGEKPKNDHPFVGRFCLARCYASGVHVGEVVSVQGENVILKNSLRLWHWKAKDGIALSGVAQHGIKSDSKIDSKNPDIYLSDVCELIPVSDKAKETFNVK